MLKNKIRNYSKFTIYIILLIGIFLRSIGLLVNKTLYIDDANNYEVARMSVKNIISGNYAHFKYHPPLYYIFYHFLIKINTSELFLRIPTFLSSIISNYLIYLLLKRLTNLKTAVIGSLLFATSSYYIFWALQIRVYSILLMVSLLYFLVILKAAKSTSFFPYILSFIVGIIGINLDLSFIWSYLIITIYLIQYYLKNKNPGKNFKIISFLSTSLYIPFFLISYILIVNNSPYPLGRIRWISYPDLFSTLNLIKEYIVSDEVNRLNIGVTYKVLLFFLSIAFMSLAIKGLFDKFIKKNNSFILLLVFPLIISFIISQYFPMFISRNLFIVGIGILALIAITVHKTRFSYLILFFWTALNLIGFMPYIILPPREDIPSAMFYIKQNSNNNSKIYFWPNWFYTSFKYYNNKYQLFSDKNIILGNVDKKDFIKENNFCVLIRRDNIKIDKILFNNLYYYLKKMKIKSEETISGINIYCTKGNI